MVVGINHHRHPVACAAQRPACVRIGHLRHPPHRVVHERLPARRVQAVEIGQGGLQDRTPDIVLRLHRDGLGVGASLLLRDRAPQSVKIGRSRESNLCVRLDVLRADRA